MAKAKKAKEQKVWSVGVVAESQTFHNNDGDKSDEPYSYRGTTNTSWYVRGLVLIDDNDPNRRYVGYHESTPVAFEPERGQVYHLLYAVYSTGDSFGTDYGRCFEVIGVYKDREVAEENLKRLENGPPRKYGEYAEPTVELKLEGSNKAQRYYRPWMGYFERLDRLELESFVLN